MSFRNSDLWALVTLTRCLVVCHVSHVQWTEDEEMSNERPDQVYTESTKSITMFVCYNNMLDSQTQSAIPGIEIHIARFESNLIGLFWRMSCNRVFWLALELGHITNRIVPNVPAVEIIANTIISMKDCTEATWRAYHWVEMDRLFLYIREPYLDARHE